MCLICLQVQRPGKNVEDAFHHLAELMFKFDPVTASGEESENELETLKDALDYIMHDFCDNYGNFGRWYGGFNSAYETCRNRC